LRGGVTHAARGTEQAAMHANAPNSEQQRQQQGNRPIAMDMFVNERLPLKL